MHGATKTIGSWFALCAAIAGMAGLVGATCYDNRTCANYPTNIGYRCVDTPCSSSQDGKKVVWTNVWWNCEKPVTGMACDDDVILKCTYHVTQYMGTGRPCYVAPEEDPYNGGACDWLY